MPLRSTAEVTRAVMPTLSADGAIRAVGGLPLVAEELDRLGHSLIARASESAAAVRAKLETNSAASRGQSKRRAGRQSMAGDSLNRTLAVASGIGQIGGLRQNGQDFVFVEDH